MRKYIKLIVFIFFLQISLFAENGFYKNILDYRYKNDPTHSLIKNEAEIAKNNYKIVRLNTFINTELSTGFVNMGLNKDKEKNTFSIEPYISSGVPIANNLGLKLSIPYSSENGGKNISKGFQTALSFDIYSQLRNSLKQKTNEAYDIFQLAQKKVSMSENIIEKKLLQDIKNILSEYGNFLLKKSLTVQANINYMQTRTQGYGENSAKLRSAKLSLMSAAREEKEALFSFEVSAKLFFQSCGIKIEKEQTEDFFLTLASEIPNKKIIPVENLTSEKYINIIKAEKEFKNKLIKNKIELNPLTMSGEVKFSRMDIASQVFNPNNSTYEKNNKDDTSFQTGFNILFPGGKIYTGVKIPVSNKEKNPLLFQMSFTLDPIAIYDYTLKRKNSYIDIQNEKIKLDELKENFENELKALLIQKEKYEWQQNLCSEELKIYKTNSEDHQVWFKQGVISSFENMKADLEYKNSVIRYATANIDIGIFNVRIEELFDFNKN